METTTEDERREAYVEALERLGDRQKALDASACTLQEIDRWRKADKVFAAATNLAWAATRLRQASLVTDRLMGVVLNGAPMVQTFRGHVQHELARHPDGQPILDPLKDAQGNPIVGYDKDGRELPRYTQRLKLDENGNPIPVVVRAYAEKSTIKVAESLGILTPPEEAVETRGGKDVVLLDSEGNRFSISEVIQKKFSATKPKILPTTARTVK